MEKGEFVKKIVVIGSRKDGNQNEMQLAAELGKTIAEKNFVLLTGATGGMPMEAVRAAKEAGGKTIGISPAKDLEEHARKYGENDYEKLFDALVFTGFGWKLRNPILVFNGDAVIMAGGGVGSLNEFTHAYPDGKIIGVLESSGGIAAKIRSIVEALGEPQDERPTIIYSDSPGELVDKVAAEMEQNRRRQTNNFNHELFFSWPKTKS